jgi:hypothetical protein
MKRSTTFIQTRFSNSTHKSPKKSFDLLARG